ncbi:MAG: Omp28-related outer membrane protein [Bacteroidia bacterium]
MKTNYKKILVASATFALIFFGCKKEETKKNDDPNTGGTAPSSFTKKVLIEEFTGAWCGWCVDGHLRVDNIMSANPGKIVPVMVHQGDGMQGPEYEAYYKPTFSVSGFPTGMINRVPGTDGKQVQSRSVWENMTNAELGKKAKLGLKIDAKSIEGDGGTVKVSVGFAEDVTTKCNIIIAILEDKVTGTGSQYDQKNFYANNSQYTTHPFYSKPATITGYEHKYVLRRITKIPYAGDEIPADKTKKGSIFTTEAMVTFTGYNKQNCYIAAWVHTPGGAVENAQMVKVGEAKDWD